MQPSSRQPRLYTLLCQEGLLVDPLLWTSRHLEIVGCQFQDTRTLPTVSGSDDRVANRRRAGRASVEDWARLQAERLARSCAPRVKHYALINIMDCEGSPFEKQG